MTYTILYRSYYSAEIEASSFDEAKRIADDMDGGQFEQLDGWELDMIRCENGEEEWYA